MKYKNEKDCLFTLLVKKTEPQKMEKTNKTATKNVQQKETHLKNGAGPIRTCHKKISIEYLVLKWIY